MHINWTQTDDETPYHEDDTQWVIDGTDQEFFESPWNDASEGEWFGTLEEVEHGSLGHTVTFGCKGDDHVSLWVPEDQEAARTYLVKHRVIALRATIEDAQRELRELDG